jgi:hypothetical protein
VSYRTEMPKRPAPAAVLSAEFSEQPKCRDQGHRFPQASARTSKNFREFVGMAA